MHHSPLPPLVEPIPFYSRQRTQAQQHPVRFVRGDERSPPRRSHCSRKILNICFGLQCSIQQLRARLRSLCRSDVDFEETALLQRFAERCAQRQEQQPHASDYVALYRDLYSTKPMKSAVAPALPQLSSSAQPLPNAAIGPITYSPVLSNESTRALRRVDIAIVAGTHHLSSIRTTPSDDVVRKGPTIRQAWELIHLVADALCCSAKSSWTCCSHDKESELSQHQQVEKVLQEALRAVNHNTSSQSNTEEKNTQKDDVDSVTALSCAAYRDATLVKITEWLLASSSMATCWSQCRYYLALLFPGRRPLDHLDEASCSTWRSLLGPRELEGIARCAAHSGEWQLVAALLLSEQPSQQHAVPNNNGCEIVALAYQCASTNLQMNSHLSGTSTVSPPHTIRTVPSRPIQITEFAQLLGHVLPVHRPQPVITSTYTRVAAVVPWHSLAGCQVLPTPLRRSLVISASRRAAAGVLPGKGCLSLDDLLVTINVIRWRLSSTFVGPSQAHKRRSAHSSLQFDHAVQSAAQTEVQCLVTRLLALVNGL